MRKSLLLLTLLMLGALIFAGCGGQETSSDPDTSTTEQPEEKAESPEDRILTIAMGTDILTFDIHDHNHTATEAVHVNMFNYLFKRNAEGEIEPELVETYELLDDTSWKMTLKQGVKFHNGDELTAEDVKFTLERVATDSSLRDHPNYAQIKEVEVLGDYEFIIHTHNPEPALLNRISRLASGILPKKYIEENGWDHFLSNPVGTGPYKFVEWVRDDRIVLEPFEDYFEGKVDEWDQVVFRVIPENSTRVAELLTGNVDIAVNIPPADWDRVNNNEGTSIKMGPTSRILLLVLRATEGYPTSDVRVRQAIDYAIDQRAIVEHVLGGAGVPTRSRIVPGTFGFHPDYYDTYVYDPEKAKALLAEAGYPDGFEMTLHSPQGRYLQDREVAETIAGMLAKVGITVNIEFMEWSSFVEMRQAHNNKDAYLLGLGNSMFDAALALDWYRSERFVGETDYKNEEIDELLALAEQNMDLEEREKQYQRIIEIAAEEVPHVLLYQQYNVDGVSDRIDYEPVIDEMIYVPNIKRK
ncbi:ABC-type transporter, periplasmic subunit [Caldalkalibacillus thermarum TA2.A1]|uniref:ABC transporter substrate-binding protein n=1 Tax=Caldalkalibacillus thermarum (strain TA2.A1) TaxID=986075 RepID=F5LA42_CALTT|nr:ABC transporter substrate-binding protein [Caldalkalibacillus thermarum]EGL81762.1 ABC-type transporter, periplasmic subunit [Caldalkalibacillus thermarum TA2.A1]QZT34137.1 ABC transporter substrate-binding protein [Caldalkalibacillus thermarum TA2.A1]